MAGKAVVMPYLALLGFVQVTVGPAVYMERKDSVCRRDIIFLLVQRRLQGYDQPDQSALQAGVDG